MQRAWGDGEMFTVMDTRWRFCNSEVIIAEHPELKVPILFLRNGHSTLASIIQVLKTCNLVLQDGEDLNATDKKYFLLEEKDGEEKGSGG